MQSTLTLCAPRYLLVSSTMQREEEEEQWPKLMGVSEEKDDAIEALAKKLAQNPTQESLRAFAERWWLERAEGHSNPAVQALSYSRPPGYGRMFADEVFKFGAKQAILNMLKRTNVVFGHPLLRQMVREGLLHFYTSQQSQALLADYRNLPAWASLRGRNKEGAMSSVLMRKLGILRLRSDVVQVADQDPDSLVSGEYIVSRDFSGDLAQGTVIRRFRFKTRGMETLYQAFGHMAQDQSGRYWVHYIIAYGGLRIGNVLGTHVYMGVDKPPDIYKEDVNVEWYYTGAELL